MLVVTSQGGVMEAAEIAEAPIHSINSGPAMAPVAGRYYADLDAKAQTAIVTDTGGTTTTSLSFAADGFPGRERLGSANRFAVT